ncbi:hypothetical protein F4861DRAFT_546930 [Xylaria intraflava]|nr:hypothetical protein F4861DRAFT_546930 [Xylaria intraflava]
MASESQKWLNSDVIAEMEAQNTMLLAAEATGRDISGDPRLSDGAIITDPELETSARSSGSHWASEPGFEHIDGDVDGHGYNDTTVDIVAVPCIGASPVDTWARDPLSDGYFAPPPTELGKYSTVKELPASSILTPTISHTLPKANHLWIRQGIRKEVSKARVLLYRHRELVEGMTIEKAADDLLEQVTKIRAGLDNARPLFFICHSVGGLVVKSALVKAKQDEELKQLAFNCHGITFFATPHRGSSYLSMPNLRESIENLLFLEQPLPISITEELRLGYKPLLQLHNRFVDLVSEIRVWTFYETVDSQLSGLGSNSFNEVHFSAPITSIKSGLVGSRGERALSIESDHAHCASFGLQNQQIMLSYLRELGAAVCQAEQLSLNFVHTPLRLSHKVKVELTGFYEDTDKESNHSTRLYISRHFLKEFLEKGPEECFQVRMNTMAPRIHGAVYARSRRGFMNPHKAPDPTSVRHYVQEPGRRVPGPTDISQASHIPRQPSPEIVVTSDASRRPSLTGATSDPLPNVDVSSKRSRGLTVPVLTTPGVVQPSSRTCDENAGRNTSEIGRTLSESRPKPREEQDDTEAGRTTDESLNIGKRSIDLGSGSPRTAVPELMAGFSRPNPLKRKFMWIHLPFNNPFWVKCIFDKISKDQNRDYSKLLSNNYWASKHVHSGRANWHASYVKTGCGFVPAETGQRSPSPGRRRRSASPNNSPAHFYLYLPYLHYDTYVNMIRRRKILRRRIKHGRARPVPQDIAELDSLEAQVIWAYIGYDPPFNTRRTLDQYGYPALQDTWARDDDQMLYKLTKERTKDPLKRKRDMYVPDETPSTVISPVSRLASAVDRFIKQQDTIGIENAKPDPDEGVINGNVLMVDQLWLWAVDNTTLMTFFPKRESHPIEGSLFQQADLRNSIYNELNGDLTGRCENALDLAAFVTLHAVTVLLDRASHPDLEVFQLFEEAIGILTEKMTSCLKEFRMQSYSKVYDDSDSDDPDDSGSRAIKRRYQRELERAERQNRENTSALLELRDMEDELHTLLHLFAMQQDTIQSMERDNKSDQSFTEFGRGYLKEALQRLDEYEKQASDMLARVDFTRKDFEKLQEMIQRQAQVDDVRWSRLQTELASSQNLSVMIFTIFTVIFLPLSFFTGLFGMNTQEWGGPNENDFLSLKLIGAISLPASAFLIIIALVAAFSGRVQGQIGTCYRALRALAERTKYRLAWIMPQASKESAKKRRQIKEIEDKRKQQNRERRFDFWGAVRSERRTEYEIPESNRKRALRGRLGR